MAIAASGNHSVALFEGITPGVMLLPATAGAYPFNVNFNTAWTASGTPDWVNLSANSGSGRLAVTATVQANPDAMPRLGAFTIAGRTESLYQAGGAPQIGALGTWGDDAYGESSIPSGSSGYRAVAAGNQHTLALKMDGTVTGWGFNGNGQITIPDGLSGVVAIAAGNQHSLALKSDGAVVGWGYNAYGEATSPDGLSGVVAIAAGAFHSLALKSDGTVLGWGYDGYGQATSPDGLSGVVAIAAGYLHSLALKSDGTVLGWGYNGYGEATSPDGLSGVVAIAAGDYHSLALKSDGTVVAWGYNGYGQTAVPDGLSGVVAIAAGASHSLALKSDGTVVAWGNNGSGQITVPSGLSAAVAIAASGNHSVALTNGYAFATAPAISLQPLDVAVAAGSDANFAIAASGSPTPLYQWRISTDGGVTWSQLSESASYAGTNTAALTIHSATAAMSGDQFQCVVSNGVNPAATSQAAALTVLTPFQQWQILHFGSTTADGAQVTDDPNHDGIANLLRFVLGGDPHVPGSTPLPTLTATPNSGGATMVFRYQRKLAAAAVDQVVEYTADLSSAAWVPAVNGQAGVTIATSPVDGETEQVTVTIPVSGITGFARLNVSE